MIKDYIDKIVKNGNQEDMEYLSDILEELMYKLKKYDSDCFHHYKMKLYVMANGEVLNEELAKDIVHDMRPDGEHWNMNQTTQVKNQYGITDISDVDFYIVMNMAYNDYKSLFGEDVNLYVKYTKAFIHDEDAKTNKVFKYFTKVA